MTRAVVVAAGAHIFSAAHVPALDACDVEVVGVFDAAAARAEAVAAPRGWPVAASLDELLAIDADIAIVCAPHPLHAELVVAALEHGLDVIVEKPLAGRPSELDEVADAAARTGRRVAVVHQHRFRAEVVEARRLIASGAIGRVHRAVLTASYPKRSVYYTDTPWRGTWSGEGGVVALNQGLHDLDVLVHLLGAPERVAADLRTVVQPIQTEDTADLLVAWPSGATASIHITSAAALGPNSLTVHGSAGALRISADGLERAWVTEDVDVFTATAGGHFDPVTLSGWQLVVEHDGGTHTDAYADVLGAWADGRQPAVTIAEARGAVELLSAAVVADDEQRWVAVPVDPAVFDRIVDARIAAASESLAVPA